MQELEFLKGILPHGIGVVAVLIVVRYFLTHQKHEGCENRKERESRDKLFVDAIAARDRLFTDTVTVIHKDNMEARAISRDAIRENTVATNRVSDKLEILASIQK